MIAEIIDNCTIYIYDKTQFNWYQIRNSGQIFRDPLCEITEEPNKIIIKATGNRDSKWLWNFFDLDTDYNKIKSELAKFPSLTEPINHGAGIRILRQPLTETIISFIISANNNIKRFTKTIAQLDFDNLGKYSESDFSAMGCGYRAPYLVKAIKQLAEIDEKELSKLPNTDLQKQLQKISGVGPKVASCIMLFADPFHRLDVAPVDTWIARALPHLPQNHKYSGIAQQYLFYYLQHLKKGLGKI